MKFHLRENDIQRYLDGETDHSEKQGIEKHLQECTDCRQQVAEYRLIFGALREDPGYGLTPQFSENLMSRIEQEKQSVRLSKVWQNLGALGGVILGIIVSLYYTGLKPYAAFWDKLNSIFFAENPSFRELYNLLDTGFQSHPEIFGGATLVILFIILLDRLFTPGNGGV
ncbi:MAG: zf-HC2 domain-containing protein [Calditrichia bacterium]